MIAAYAHAFQFVGCWINHVVGYVGFLGAYDARGSEFEYRLLHTVLALMCFEKSSAREQAENNNLLYI